MQLQPNHKLQHEGSELICQIGQPFFAYKSNIFLHQLITSDIDQDEQGNVESIFSCLGLNDVPYHAEQSGI